MKAIFLAVTIILAAFSGCFGSDDILSEKRGIPGGLTLACLQDSQFTSMELVFLYEEGYEPEASDLLKSRLDQVCEKSTVRIRKEIVNFEHSGSWSSDDIRDQRWDLGADAMQENTLRWYFLFPSGVYEKDSVLGVAVDASTVAIFKDSVADAEGFLGRPSAEEVERSVAVHELGHLLGLVNLVYTSPIDHEDSNNKGHSINDNSVMYWAIESSDVGNFISGDLPDEYDADDKSDLSGLADGTISAKNQIWS